MRGYSDKTLNERKQSVGNLKTITKEHRLCFPSTLEISKWDMGSYRKPAVAEGNRDDIYYKRPFHMCNMLNRSS